MGYPHAPQSRPTASVKSEPTRKQASLAATFPASLRKNPTSCFSPYSRIAPASLSFSMPVTISVLMTSVPFAFGAVRAESAISRATISTASDSTNMRIRTLYPR